MRNKIVATNVHRNPATRAGWEPFTHNAITISSIWDVGISVIVPMVYSPQNARLDAAPHFFRALSWLAVSFGALVLGDPGLQIPGLRLKVIATLVFLGCISVASLIGGFGVLFRRNWARILAIIVAAPLILMGLWDLYGFLRLPASVIRSEFIVRLIVLFVLPFLATIAWLALLVGKRVRAEFLPPAMAQIYVNLLNEGASRARPMQALTLGNGLFELLPTEGYDPDVEQWEFRPGSIVRGKEGRRDGEAYLLATSFGP